MRNRLSVFLAIAVFAAVLATETYGFRTGNLFSQPIWASLGLTRFGHYTRWFPILVVPALILIPRVFVAFVTGLILVATVVSVGPLSVFAVVFFLISACALGSLVLRQKGDARSVMAGIAIYIFAMTMLARMPVNYPLVWGVILAVPILANLRGTGQRLVCWARLLVDADLKSWAERGAFAALLFSLTMNWLVTLKPETSSDGLAMHLAIATNIAAHHMMTFQPGRLVWSVMPMGADWIFSITGLLGGEMAARLVNLAMLLLLEVQIYGIIRRRLSRPVCLLLLALSTTTPMVQLVTGSLFVENLLAAVIVGALNGLCAFAETGEKKSLYLAMGLSGTALATKFGALSIVGFVLVMAIFEVWRRRALPGFKPGLTLAFASGLFVVAAIPTYAIAWQKTGDPLFPFLNQKFPSPVLDHDADFNDMRFRRPVTLNTPFDLTFRTSFYYEGQDGSLGFQFLLLIPFALLAGIVARRKAAAITVIAATGGLAVVLITLPNARYMYPALVLFTIPFAVFLEWLSTRQRWLYYATLVFILACIGLNIWFFPSAGWYHKDFYAKNPFSRAGREAYLRDYVQLRYVAQKFDHEHPGASVYLDAFSDIADLRGEAYGAFLHQWRTMMTMRKTRGVPNLARLFRKWKVQYFIVEDAYEPVSTDLHDFLAVCTKEQFRDGQFYLAALLPVCNTDNQATLVSQAYSRMRQLGLVQEGAHDDMDAAIQFRGNWAHSTIFPLADSKTISFSDSPDSEVAMAFDGTAVTYVFTRAANRGLAEVTIDGVSKGNVDLYSENTQWQNKARFCCLAKGPHTIVVRVTGLKSPGASGDFVDLDSFVVE